jgi:hypothetical protein
VLRRRGRNSARPWHCWSRLPAWPGACYEPPGRHGLHPVPQPGQAPSPGWRRRLQFRRRGQRGAGHCRTSVLSAGARPRSARIAR